jgi:hydroxymethylpyrimidine pyrophosphatase-like HAD family hydrolase
MYFLALATDYDGTLAEEEGVVSAATLAALRQIRGSGRKLLMVTGRELPDLERVFPHLALFDKVVAENGALLYTPATRQENPIAPPPPPMFVEELKKRGVAPLSVGRSIVATREPHETVVLEVIKAIGLELEIVFNKGAVMVLPSGVNKATGLVAALADMGLSAQHVVGVGDAENDHSFLRMVGCGVAVANALPTLKHTADLVTQGARGAGVVELIADLIALDAKLLGARPQIPTAKPQA